MGEAIAVVGLGYVGLPLAEALARKFGSVIGFDLNPEKVKSLCENNPIPAQLKITGDRTLLKTITFFIVAVPTPIDHNNCPDLQPLIKASEIIGSVLKPGVVIVYESTVYPGVTEEICAQVLAQASGLKPHLDFKLGYSPERINPGDPDHTLEKITKIVAGEDSETLERVARVYEPIIEAGIYRAPSIKVAEAAKVIENIQRDINIALMNEIAMICDRLQIPTRDVLAAANTKWNFLPFQPGLVGGHCIGVDPYYLAAKAVQLGHYPEIILAGRRINDNMGIYIAQRLLQLLAKHSTIPFNQTKIGILGITFKENITDIRNSRIPDIYRHLQKFGITPLIHDPLANIAEVEHEYQISLSSWQEFIHLDALILAVTHPQYLKIPLKDLLAILKPHGIFIDVKSAINPKMLPAELIYWSL